MIHLLLFACWLMGNHFDMLAADHALETAARGKSGLEDAIFKLHPAAGEFIRTWLILGPVGPEPGSTSAPAEGQRQVVPANEMDFVSAPTAARPRAGVPQQVGAQTVLWRQIVAKQDTIELGTTNAGFAYAWTEVVAPRTLSLLLGLGTDGAVKVWVNGAVVLDKRSTRALRKDEDLIPVKLNKGVNRLLLRIGTRPSGSRFLCRFLNQAAVSEQLVNAAMNGPVERLALLLTNGATVNAKVGPGLTAWQAAHTRGRVEAATLLQTAGANTNRAFPSPAKTINWLMTQRIPADGPGLALAVVQDGRLVFNQAWGMASLDYQVPITPSTVFHVASVSKQFTAFAIALLEQQGKLSVDDPLRKYVPEMYDFGKPITLRQLLYHTSGLRDQWDLLVIAGWRMDDVITQQDILSILQRQRELNFAPGEEHLYCNSGYTLLAEVVSRVSGKPFIAFTQDEIFHPLGMTNTHFHLNHEQVVRNMAYSYAPSPSGGYQKTVLSYANVGATSLFTTVEDLARWIANFENAKLGGPELEREMQQKGKLNNGTEIDYGFGLALEKLRGARSVCHAGGDAGYRSYLLWLPEHHLGVALLSNLGTMDVARMAQLVAEVCLPGKLAPLPTRSRPASAKSAYPVSPSVLERYVGKYQGASGRVISIIRDGDLLKGDISAGALQILRPSAEHEFAVTESNARVVFAKLETGKAAQYTVEMDGQKRVYQRADPGEQTSVKLDDYAGTYHSDEVELTCRIQTKGNRLIIQHRRHGEIELRQNSRDRFTGSEIGLIRFDRDAAGKITGFKLTTGRVRNLQFKRQPLAL